MRDRAQQPFHTFLLSLMEEKPWLLHCEQHKTSGNRLLPYPTLKWKYPTLRKKGFDLKEVIVHIRWRQFSKEKTWNSSTAINNRCGTCGERFWKDATGRASPLSIDGAGCSESPIIRPMTRFIINRISIPSVRSSITKLTREWGDFLFVPSIAILRSAGSEEG